MQSPFKCGGAVKTIPPGNYLIRTDGSGSHVNICINGTPSSTSAHYFLKDTDVIEIDSNYEIMILNIVTDPDIYVAQVKRKA